MFRLFLSVPYLYRSLDVATNFKHFQDSSKKRGDVSVRRFCFVHFQIKNDQIYHGPPLCFANLLTRKVRLPIIPVVQVRLQVFHCFGVQWRKGNRNSICVVTHHFILKAKTQYILAFIFLGTGFWHLSLLHRYSLAQNCPQKEIYNTRKKCSFSLNLESS